MATNHTIVDKDPHFVINPTTRALSTESKKIALIQGDHNSERFTFELPREVEGHTMPNCDTIEVHYINIDAKTKEQSEGVYAVADVTTKEEDPETIRFSWLISHQATRYMGALNFLVRFLCHDENDNIIYAWHSAIYTGIAIASGMNNGEEMIEDYTDILLEWKNQLEANQIKSLVQTKVGEGDEGENVWTATFGDGRTSELKVKNGSRGPTGLIGSIETITGDPLHFFVGEREDYEALTPEQQADLFALFTDDPTDQSVQTLKGGIEKNDLEFITNGTWSPDPCGNYYSYGETDIQVEVIKGQATTEHIKGWQLKGYHIVDDYYLQELRTADKIFVRTGSKVDGVRQFTNFTQIAGPGLIVAKAHRATFADQATIASKAGGLLGRLDAYEGEVPIMQTGVYLCVYYDILAGSNERKASLLVVTDLAEDALALSADNVIKSIGSTIQAVDDTAQALLYAVWLAE